ncbi:MAG: indolepyruvate oxidoreductase subunit beta [Clostridia bacterium]|nr:indolepyruvate oxidoreductase subunit beta [Clostridia bacterium]
MKTTSIMIVGVGGQGTLLASRLIGHVLIEKGYDVKLSEVHGMSQRGGSVVTYVKYGEKVFSPIVDPGEADFILSFEAIEGARWIACLAPNGKLITNTQKMYPMPVITGAMEYPKDAVEKLKGMSDTISVDALEMAKSAGSTKAANTVLLGVLSRYMPEIETEAWMEAIESIVKPQFVELNKKAFMMGRDA